MLVRLACSVKKLCKRSATTIRERFTADYISVETAGVTFHFQTSIRSCRFRGHVGEVDHQKTDDTFPSSRQRQAEPMQMTTPDSRFLHHLQPENVTSSKYVLLEGLREKIIAAHH